MRKTSDTLARVVTLSLALLVGAPAALAQTAPSVYVTGSTKAFSDHSEAGKRKAQQSLSSYNKLAEAKDAESFQAEHARLTDALAGVKSSAARRVAMLGAADENKATAASLEELISAVGKAETAAAALTFGTSNAQLGDVLAQIVQVSKNLGLTEPMDWALLGK